MTDPLTPVPDDGLLKEAVKAETKPTDALVVEAEQHVESRSDIGYCTICLAVWPCLASRLTPLLRAAVEERDGWKAIAESNRAANEEACRALAIAEQQLRAHERAWREGDHDVDAGILHPESPLFRAHQSARPEQGGEAEAKCNHERLGVVVCVEPDGWITQQTFASGTEVLVSPSRGAAVEVEDNG